MNELFQINTSNYYENTDGTLKSQVKCITANSTEVNIPIILNDTITVTQNSFGIDTSET